MGKPLAITLDNLGITRAYDSSEPTSLSYTVISRGGSRKFENPNQLRRYLRDVVKVISEDATEQGGLEDLTIHTDFDYVSRELKQTATELRNNTADKAIVKRDRAHLIADIPTWAGGIAGWVVTYSQACEWAVGIADGMDRNSHLWAPLSGIAETVVSVGLPAAVGLVAAMAVSRTYGNIVGLITGNFHESGFLEAERYRQISRAQFRSIPEKQAESA